MASDRFDDEYDDEPRRPRRSRAARAAGLVSGPAVGLIVTGVLSILNAGLGLVMQVSGMNERQFADARKQMESDPKMNPQAKAQAMEFMDTWERITKTATPISIGLSMATGVVVLIGGVKMKNLSSKGWATIASVVAMIPCIGCCVVGIPIGIWSLVTLGKPEVKAAFAAADPDLAGDLDDRM